MPKIYAIGDKLLATELTEIVKVAGLYATDGGIGDAYAITVTPAPSGYVTGDVYTFKATAANVGPATLNVNGLGAKTIKKNVSDDLSDNDIKAGQLVTVQYDGTNFQLKSRIGIKYAKGTTSFSSTTTTVITTGFKPAKITVYALIDGRVFSQGSYDVAAGTGACVYASYDTNGGVVDGNASTNVWDLQTGSGLSAKHQGTITNVTDTGFTLSNTKTNSPAGAKLFWEAIA